MHIKVRCKAAALYRSAWVKKGAEGNSHGFAIQRYVGSIALTALAVPEELRSKLVPTEVAYVEKAVCEPARRDAEARQRAEETRSACPLWRLEAAARLAQEAAERSLALPVPTARVAAVTKELDKVRLLGPEAPTTSPARPDALREALAAVKAATIAVEQGGYGKGPSDGMKKTQVYKVWAEISNAVNGDKVSLLRALQGKGFVARKGG